MHYRPLAEFLIGAGARISEALALTLADVDLDGRTVQIRRQHPRRGELPMPTKGKRARSVHIGPGLTATLKLLRQDRLDSAVDDCGWLFLCPVPSASRARRHRALLAGRAPAAVDACSAGGVLQRRPTATSCVLNGPSGS